MPSWCIEHANPKSCYSVCLCIYRNHLFIYQHLNVCFSIDCLGEFSTVKSNSSRVFCGARLYLALGYHLLFLSNKRVFRYIETTDENPCRQEEMLAKYMSA